MVLVDLFTDLYLWMVLSYLLSPVYQYDHRAHNAMGDASSIPNSTYDIIILL